MLVLRHVMFILVSELEHKNAITLAFYSFSHLNRTFVCVDRRRRVFVYLQFAKLLAIIVRKSKFKVWDEFSVLFDPLDTSVHFFVS